MPEKPKNDRVRLTASAQPASLDEARSTLGRQSRLIDRLNFLVEATKVLNSTLDLPELLDRILRMVTEQTRAERGTVFLVDHDRRDIWSLLAHGLEQQEIRLPMGQGIAGSVATSGEVVNLEEAYNDPRFDSAFDQRFGYRTQSLLCLPVRDRGGKIVGVVQLLNKRDTGGFTRDDVEFLQDLSVHVAIALENARLHRESIERQKLEKELSLARSIQRGLLPDSPPVLDAFDVSVRHESSLYVGGDYYDFIQPNPETFAFVIADVEGKGVAASLIMANLQATLQAVILHVHSLEGILFTLNDVLVARSKKFLSLFLGLVDLRGHSLHYINAGHVPPVIVRRHGEPEHLKEGGMVLGLFPQQRYRRGVTQLRSDDVLLACTDGITEAANPQEEQYETGRIIQVARKCLPRTAREIVDAVFADVEAFEQGGVHLDDKVMMAIKVR